MSNFELIENLLNLENKTNLELKILEQELNQNKEISYKYINFKNLAYLLSTLCLIGITLYIYNNNLSFINFNKINHLEHLDTFGNILFNISGEISKSCTVKSWDIIHDILKKINQNNIDKVNIILELENLKKMNIEFPGEFSLNSNSFEKSLIKLIIHLKKNL